MSLRSSSSSVSPTWSRHLRHLRVSRMRLRTVALCACALVALAVAEMVLMGGTPAPPKLARGVAGDFVAVMTTTQGRHALVEAGRATWRNVGVKLRTAVVTNTSTFPASRPSNEVWHAYPDTMGFGPAYFAGDPRMVFSLMWANLTFASGGYKWLLFGDDDTFFVLHNAARLVAGLDSNVPYIITDALNYWQGGHQSHPYCLLSPDSPPTPLSSCRALPVRVPCDVPYFCRCASLWRNGCGWGQSWFYGGGGAIVSVGAMRGIGVEEWLPCVFELKGGGDARIAECFWRHGLGISKPNPATRGAKSFYYNPPEAFYREVSYRGARCSVGTRCRMVRENAVAVHMKAKEDLQGAVQRMYRLHRSLTRRGWFW